MGRLTAHGMSPLFTMSSVIDAMNPTVNLAEIDQGGFTLPAREMYLTPSQLLTDYEKHITNVRACTWAAVVCHGPGVGEGLYHAEYGMWFSWGLLSGPQMFTLLGDDATVAATKAHGVVVLETALAKAALPADEIRYCTAVSQYRGVTPLGVRRHGGAC